MKKLFIAALCLASAVMAQAKPIQIFNDDQAEFLKNTIIVTEKDVESIPGYNITTYRRNGKIYKIVTNAVFRVTGKQNNNPLLGKLKLSEEQKAVILEKLNISEEERTAISNRLAQAQADLTSVRGQLAEKIAANEELQANIANLQTNLSQATERVSQVKTKLTEAAENNKLLAPIINALKKQIFGDDD